MPARVGETIVLRTYPLQEADLIVSFFTRDFGKLRGVAKRARRPKSKFGAGLERLSQVRMSYYQKENRELATLDSCELIHSQFKLAGDYTASVALDAIAEITEQLLPAGEANERFFRLLNAVLEHLRSETAPGGVWRAVTYFALWAVKLGGFLPDLAVCLGCGRWLDDPEHPARAFFTRSDPGLLCGECKRNGAWELSAESRAVAREMFRRPVSEFGGQAWSNETAADLRRYLLQRIEDAIERRLITGPILEAC